MGSVLVVGGTGILAPAVAELAARGDRVTVVSRGGSAGAGSEGLACDARDPRAVALMLRDRQWERALVYSPAIADATEAAIRGRVRGRCILVRTSAAVDPELGDARAPPDVLQLGWVAAAGGRAARWHSPTEVSNAALALLDGGPAVVLGAIRPWDSRPV